MIGRKYLNIVQQEIQSFYCQLYNYSMGLPFATWDHIKSIISLRFKRGKLYCLFAETTAIGKSYSDLL